MPTPDAVLVPEMPTEAMWGGLARQLVFWNRFERPTGAALYEQLTRIGCEIPAWLRSEIQDNDHVPPKGTVAACIYRAMIDARPESLRNAAPALLAKCEHYDAIVAENRRLVQSIADEANKATEELRARLAAAMAVVSAAKALYGTKTMLEDASAKFGEIGNPYAAQVALHRDDQALRDALSTYEGKSQ